MVDERPERVPVCGPSSSTRMFLRTGRRESRARSDYLTAQDTSGLRLPIPQCSQSSTTAIFSIQTTFVG